MSSRRLSSWTSEQSPRVSGSTGHRIVLGVALLATLATPAFAQRKKTATAKAAAKSTSAPADWSAVESALGRKGASQPGDVMKFSFPRSDFSPVLQGVPLKPALALGSWVAFSEPVKGRSLAMGDLVLAEDEVNPVIDMLRKGGVEIVGVHNHLIMEVPPVKYLHFHAEGDAAAIARTVRTALEATHTPLDTTGLGAPVGLIDLDTAAIARIIGVRGKPNGGVYQISIPRAKDVKEGKTVIPPAMGVATVLNFQPTGAGRSAATGDFALTAREVEPVMSALRRAGIDVTALHSHMLDEEPRLFFMHFWAHDDTDKVARGLRSALDAARATGR